MPSSAFRERLSSWRKFFFIRGPSLFKILSPKLAEWFLHAEDRQRSSHRPRFEGKSLHKSDSLWEFVKVIGSKKCFKEFVFFLRRGFKRLSREGKTKIAMGSSSKRTKFVKECGNAHTRAGSEGKRSRKREVETNTRKFFIPWSRKSLFQFRLPSPQLARTLSLRQCRKTRKKNV